MRRWSALAVISVSLCGSAMAAQTSPDELAQRAIGLHVLSKYCSMERIAFSLNEAALETAVEIGGRPDGAKIAKHVRTTTNNIDANALEFYDAIKMICDSAKRIGVNG